jgi:hypothetical protein
MKILFTTGKTQISDLILWATQEDVSHVALQVTLEGTDFVIHSNGKGLHIETLSSFLKKSKIIYALEKKTEEGDLRRILELFQDKEWTMYDLGATLFLGFSLLLRRYLKLPLPKSNLWQSTGMFMCVEWVSWVVDLKEESMCTPKRLHYILLGRPEWSSVNG